MVEDVTTALIRSLAFFRDVDGARSVAGQRNALMRVYRRGDFSEAVFRHLDPATQNRIGVRYPGGNLALQSAPFSAKDFRKAVLLAIGDLGPGRHGRPAETDSLALRQLALDLAHTFHTHTGELPTRRVDAWNGSREYGPFYDFVGAVLAILPPLFRKTISKRGPKRVNHVVRLGVQEYTLARNDPNPSRRWNIDESLWLGPTA